jgi:hypothetical protein
MIYSIQIEFEFEVDEMMVIFWVFTSFPFCFVHMYWRNIPPPSSGALNQFRWIYLEDGVSMFP